MRAELSFRDWSDIPHSERRITLARPAHAAALFGVLRKYKVPVANAALMLEINERQMTKYLEARTPIPTTVDDALPRDMGDDFAAARAALRCVGEGSTPERTARAMATLAAERFRTALADLERTGASSDLLLEAMGRLGALSARARGGR